MTSIKTSEVFVVSSLMAALGAILALQKMPWVFCFALSLSFFLLALCFKYSRKAALALVLSFVLMYASGFRYDAALLPAANDLAQVRAHSVTFCASVLTCKTRDSPGGVRQVLEVAPSRLILPWSHPLGGRVLVLIEPIDNGAGQKLQTVPGWGGTYLFTGLLTRPAARVFSFEPDQRRRLALRNIFCQVTCAADAINPVGPETDSSKTTAPGQSGLTALARKCASFVASVRESIIRDHCLAIGTERGQLLTSMVLGDRAVSLSDSIKDTFMKVGLSHLLAASGLNLTIIVGSVFFIFRRSRASSSTPRGAGERPLSQTLAALICVLFFVSLAGASPSVTRATVMCLLLLWSTCIFRKLAPGAALAGALWLALILDPSSILDVGLQLSYGATFGIIYFYPLLAALPARSLSKPLAWLYSIAAVVMAAQLAVLPVQISCFQKMSTLVVPANILAEPLVAPITVMGFVSSFICALGRMTTLLLPHGAGIIAALLCPMVGLLAKTAVFIDFFSGFLLDLLLALAKFLAALPLSNLYLAGPPVVSIVFYYLALLLAFVDGLARPARGAGLALGAGLVLTAQSFLFSPILEVLVDGTRVVVASDCLRLNAAPAELPCGGKRPSVGGYLPGFHRDFVLSFLRSRKGRAQPLCFDLASAGGGYRRCLAGKTLLAIAFAPQPGGAGEGSAVCLSSDLPPAAIKLEEAQGVRLYKCQAWGLLWLFLSRHEAEITAPAAVHG